MTRVSRHGQRGGAGAAVVWALVLGTGLGWSAVDTREAAAQAREVGDASDSDGHPGTGEDHLPAAGDGARARGPGGSDNVDEPGAESGAGIGEAECGGVVCTDLAAAHSGGHEEGMEGDALRLQPIPVTTTIGRPVGARQVHRPTTVLHGDRLQRGMGSSVPATLEGVPGVHSSFNGPGAASPVIRGLPGDRVLMLEDGHRTGDIYWTAADHGVMAEPLTSERIEVVRGPAGLLYGANALGGVVNVIRDDIPTRTLDAWSTMLALQGESVSDGVAGAVVSRGAAGPLDLHVEGAARRSGDMRTPAGRLEDTDMRVLSGALGASVAPSWGRAGVSVRGYGSRYGVPGEFDGVLIPGGHPGGVSIEVDRLAVRGLVDVAVGSPAIEQVEVRGSGTLFDQREIEGTLVGEDVIGARFEQISGDVRVLARHSALAVADGLTGAFGMALQGRFLEAGGASPGTRSGRELDLGVFAYEELRLEPFRVQLAARHDLRAVTTDDLSDIRVRTEERRIVKPVASRMFHAPSLSLSGLWDLADHWTLGLGLSRAARPPTIEELYSDGPHLADFSFDIGSPELGVETGHGVDLFLRSDHRRVELEVAGYVNHMRRFIQYAPTGETVFVFREGVEPRETPVYEARGEDALFVGAEASLDLTLVDRWVVELSGSWVRASRVDDGDPLPWIPPLNGRLGLRFDGRILFGSAGVRAAATQSRVPRPVAIGESTARPVEPTDGHVLADLSVGWHLITPHYDHTLMLQVLNVADTAWRDHLSRIKDVAPQPGRNVQLTWRAWF